jgi:peptide deformylase
MALRNILKDDTDELSLRKKSREIKEFNAHIHELLDDMRATLILADGLGLAAPQVGVLRRAVIVVVSEDDELPVEERILELLNPEIIERGGEQEGSEGCLSVPGVYGVVARPDTVRVRAFDRDGNAFEVTGEGLTARALCHEIDHLDGVMFTDLATRFLTREELEEMRRAEREDDEDDDEDFDDEVFDETGEIAGDTEPGA